MRSGSSGSTSACGSTGYPSTDLAGQGRRVRRWRHPRAEEEQRHDQLSPEAAENIPDAELLTFVRRPLLNPDIRAFLGEEGTRHGALFRGREADLGDLARRCRFLGAEGLLDRSSRRAVQPAISTGGTAWSTMRSARWRGRRRRRGPARARRGRPRRRRRPRRLERDRAEQRDADLSASAWPPPVPNSA